MSYSKLLTYLFVAKLLIIFMLGPYHLSHADHHDNDSNPVLTKASSWQQHQKIELQYYYLSEKYDGVRAYWNGEKLLSRSGNIIHAPDWFSKNFPDYALDGELWIGYQKFSQVVSTVRKLKPIDSQWRDIQYLIFDSPTDKKISFQQRLKKLRTLRQLNIPWLKTIKQTRINNTQQLQTILNDVIKKGGEGLMLHHQDALYHNQRNQDLIKIKVAEDAEAKVIGYTQGKGKYLTLVGALKVVAINGQAQGKTFNIGSGLSDKLRANPPAVGTIISYKFNGLTRHGLPRHARYWRMREDMLLNKNSVILRGAD